MAHDNCYLHSVQVERIILLIRSATEKCNLMNLMMVEQPFLDGQ